MPNNIALTFDLPESQEWLVELFKALGYTPEDENKQIGEKPYLGLCYGIGHTVVPAALLGQLDIYKLRLDNMYFLLRKLRKELVFTAEEELYMEFLFPKAQYNTPEYKMLNESLLDLPEILQPILEQNGNGVLREIQIFCDAVAIYQFHKVTQYMLGEIISRQLIPALIPSTLTNLGGIEKPVENFRLNSTENNLINYFANIRKSLTNPTLFTAPVVLVLFNYHLDNPWHCVTVVFHQGKWRFIDANNFNLMNKEIIDDIEIAQMLHFALTKNVGLESTDIDLHTEVYAAGVYKEELSERLKFWSDYPAAQFTPEELEMHLKDASILEESEQKQEGYFTDSPQFDNLDELFRELDEIFEKQKGSNLLKPEKSFEVTTEPFEVATESVKVTTEPFVALSPPKRKQEDERFSACKKECRSFSHSAFFINDNSSEHEENAKKRDSTQFGL